MIFLKVKALNEVIKEFIDLRAFTFSKGKSENWEFPGVSFIV